MKRKETYRSLALAYCHTSRITGKEDEERDDCQETCKSITLGPWMTGLLTSHRYTKEE